MNAPQRQAGFSLIELAVVLVIIGLLIGGGIAALDATTEQTRRSDQRRQLEHAREALYGFAMSERRLPCPDATAPVPDGIEDRNGSPPDECTNNFGALPWVTLGLGRRDAWGHPLYYAVDPDWADAPPSVEESSFALSDEAIFFVYDDDPDSGGERIAREVPAVVVSFGPQGGQVWTTDGFECPGDTGPTAGFSSAETENCGDNPDEFVDAGYRTSGDPEGRFDDLLIWLPDPVLKARMVEAGRLP